MRTTYNKDPPATHHTYRRRASLCRSGGMVDTTVYTSNKVFFVIQTIDKTRKIL